MKMSCPSCGFVADADAFIAERETLEVLAAALTLPAPLAVPLLQYLRLFRPPKRALTSKRVSTLLAELVGPIKDAKLERHGRLWAAPLATWQDAIDQVLAKRDAAKLTLPLKSHGYLYEVVVGIASSAEGRTEQRREDELAGRTPVARPAPAPVDKATATRGLATAREALKRKGHTDAG